MPGEKEQYERTSAAERWAQTQKGSEYTFCGTDEKEIT